MDIVEDLGRGGGGGGGGALWKSHCQLLGRRDPVYKSDGDLSFLECCCVLYCDRQADAILHKEFYQQLELNSVLRIFQIDRYGQSLIFLLESFVDVECESGCVFPNGFSDLYLPLFSESTFLKPFLGPKQAPWPGTVPSAFPWYSALSGYGVRSACYGPCPVEGTM